MEALMNKICVDLTEKSQTKITHQIAKPLFYLTSVSNNFRLYNEKKATEVFINEKMIRGIIPKTEKYDEMIEIILAELQNQKN